jgi:hypothetical protein
LPKSAIFSSHFSDRFYREPCVKESSSEEAYRARNGGVPGIDGQKFEDIEQSGRVEFIAVIRQDLETGRYKPMPNGVLEAFDDRSDLLDASKQLIRCEF